MSDVIEHLYNKPCASTNTILITDEIKADIDTYYAEYGAQ